jgi:hypothetical protein
VRAALFLCALSLAAQDSRRITTDQHGMDVAEFDKAHYEYMRKYYGCPVDGPWSSETCSNARQERDVDMYDEARAKAMKAYNLTAPEKAKKRGWWSRLWKR